MDLRENRLLSGVRKWVNLSWGWALVGAPLMLVLALVFAFAPGTLTPRRLTGELCFYGANVSVTMPADAMEPGVVRNTRCALFGLAVVEAPASLCGLYQLKKILENVAKKTPFVAENAKRVRILGFTIIASAALSTLRGVLLGTYLAGKIHLAGARVAAGHPFGHLGQAVVGLIVLLLAEIFRYGIELQEELDLTV